METGLQKIEILLINRGIYYTIRSYYKNTRCDIYVGEVCFTFDLTENDKLIEISCSSYD